MTSDFAGVPAGTSRRMAAVRSKDTEPELMLRRELWRRGHRYRLHRNDLPGRPDLAFIRERVAVFVDGDFWHGRVLREKGPEEFVRGFQVRKEWWLNKVKTTVVRDDRVNSDLSRLGWTVVRLWESDIRADPGAAAKAVERFLDERHQDDH